MSALRIKRGDTWQCTWQYRDSAGDAIDLSGCSARLKLKPRYTDTETLSIGSGSGELVIDAAAGDIAQTVAASVMAEIDPGQYRADLEITWADSTVTSTETVWVEIVEDITV
jgi:hypothetical protein